MESKRVVLIEYILKMIEYVCLTNSLWCRRYMCDLIGYLYFMSISAVTMHLKRCAVFLSQSSLIHRVRNQCPYATVESC